MPFNHLPKNHQKGFSLLEAIVALVIMAGSCMALFAWINSSLQQLQRAELYSQAAPAILSATNYLKTIDLTQRPTGTFQSANITIDWTARAIETERTRSAAWGPSNFNVSLYHVELRAHHQRRLLPPLQTRIVNYRLKPGVKMQTPP